MILAREAHPSEADSIVAFQVAMARETETIDLDRETVSEGVGAVLEDPSKGRYFVAADGEEVVASLLITYEWSDWRNGWIWWIQSVWVEPEWRGRGVYRKLYGHVRDAARTAEAKGIRLYVDVGNKAAQTVYRRLGMDGDHYRVFEAMA